MNFGVSDDKERKEKEREGRDDADAVKSAMTYLDAVVHEVLRVHPPVTEMNRVVRLFFSFLLFPHSLPANAIFSRCIACHSPISLVLHPSTTELTNELQTPGSNRRHPPPLLPHLSLLPKILLPHLFNPHPERRNRNLPHPVYQPLEGHLGRGRRGVQT
jgi:hypothetical protein